MKKIIYAVMCETRQRESEEPWSNNLLYCTDTKQKAKKDFNKFNEIEDNNKILQEHYYFTEISLYTKD